MMGLLFLCCLLDELIIIEEEGVEFDCDILIEVFVMIYLWFFFNIEIFIIIRGKE